ncbi:flagellin [Falsiroseomonas sp.]|uniref:flagellin n=1 Tax=Falsiroseomonas sp. TaxID=2870721 RepID=UPI00272324DF|nr:flagellin [Falsiroseomonas sp.]MDO9503552.1 flagellin [Falsiroseomonas sp.]
MSIIGSIGNLAVDQAALRLRLDTASRQVSTGQKAQVYGDLRPEARRAIDLRGEVARREAYANAADRALARADATQTVLGRLQEIAATVGAEALRAKTMATTGAEALARTAAAALAEVAALLNTRHGGEYLFGGSDVTAPPVPDAENVTAGPMATAITAAIATLDATNAATVLADTVTAATDAATSPFSAFLEGAGTTEATRAVQVADGERVQIGVFANRGQDGEVVASWGRELLRNLAIMAAVTPALAAEGGGWSGLMDSVASAMGVAATSLANEQAMLGAAQQRIGAVSDRHQDTLVALRTQLGSVEEVDLAQAAAEMSLLKLRLEASYEATGMLSRLSLAALLR